jgi:hypothetical protein
MMSLERFKETYIIEGAKNDVTRAFQGDLYFRGSKK